LDRCAPQTEQNSYEQTPCLTAFQQVKASLVGLTGLEPAASSLSGIEGPALCGPAFPQVTGDRKGPRDAFYVRLPERRGELDATGGGSDAATLGYCGQAPEPQGDKN